MAAENMAANDVDLLSIFASGQQPNLDDFVEFEIYFDEFRTPAAPLVDVKLPNADGLPKSSPAAATRVQQTLYRRLLQVYDYLLPFIGAYSWTCSPFFVTIRAASSPEAPPCLHGRLRVGDNFQEEWVVAHLLQRVSDRFPNVSVALRDADGEFLLIEGAAALPSWLSPETAVNRVFLRRGTLSVLPRTLPKPAPVAGIIDVEAVLAATTHASATGVERVSLPDALRALWMDQLGHHVARPTVQRRLTARMRPVHEVARFWEMAPKEARPTTGKKELSQASICGPHQCNMIVPVAIAHAFRRYPQLLSVALDHLPPPVDITKKVAVFKTKWDSENGSFPFDCSAPDIVTVKTGIVLNRCQYGRLQQLRFRLPAQYTTSKWRLPGEGHADVSQNIAPQPKGIRPASYAAMDRGAKLCLGLLCAYLADTGTREALVPFLWDRESRTSSAADTIQRFLRVVGIPQDGDEFAYFQEDRLLRKEDDDDTETKQRPPVTFQSVLEAVLAEANDGPSPGSVSVVSDDEDWASLSPQEVEEMIADQQKEDVLRRLVKEELQKEQQNASAQAVATQRLTALDANENKPATPERASIATPEDAELKGFFTKFEEFLNLSSGLEGIEQAFMPGGTSRPPRLSEQARQRLRSSLPPELVEIFDDLGDIESSISEINDDDDAGTSSVDNDEGDIDQDMKELIRAMDEELSTFVTKQRRPNTKNAIVEDVETSDDDDDGPIDAKATDVPKSAFRDAAPEDLTEQELAEVLSVNLVRSRQHEGLLELGPASLLIKSVASHKSKQQTPQVRSSRKQVRWADEE